MSTSETYTQTVCECPCGKGSVVKHVTTQDNPWSSADISIELDCTSCAAEWRLEHQSLVLRSSETPYREAQDAEHKAYERLRELVDPLVDDYFARFAAKTKKAEWEEMQRLNIYSGSYRNFLDAKKTKQPGQIAYGLRNEEWLRELAGESEVVLNKLLKDRQEAKARTESARSQIVRRRIAESPQTWKRSNGTN